MKVSRKQWLLSWGVLGLVIPIVLMVNYRVCVAHVTDRTQLINCLWGEEQVILWPTAVMLMPLEAHPTPFAVVWFYSLAVVSNIFVYASVGLLTWFFVQPFVTLDPRNRDNCR